MSNNDANQNNFGRRHIVDAIKVKGKIEEINSEGVVRFFSEFKWAQTTILRQIRVN